LRGRVTGDLKKGWSPGQIAGRLRYEHNRGETDMSVSHETICTWIYAQPKGELARAGISLRTGREQRKPRGRKKSTGAKIAGMRSVEDRPAEVAGRQVPGHREGDLVIGKQGTSAMGTLAERVSRFLCPAKTPPGHDADSVKDALSGAVKDLPAHLRKSLTWDQGTEMARHAAQLGTCGRTSSRKSGRNSRHVTAGNLWDHRELHAADRGGHRRGQADRRGGEGGRRTRADGAGRRLPSANLVLARYTRTVVGKA